MKILVECFGDNLLFEILGYGIDPDHFAISNVARRMMNNYKDVRVLGVIDNDIEAVPSYFREFLEIDQIHSILFLKHKSEDRYLIKINRDFEEFILRIEKEAKVTPFRKTKSQLEEVTKTSSVINNKKFIAHLQMLIHKNPPSIAFLRKCITEATKAQ
jgi:hypothetical protein